MVDEPALGLDRLRVSVDALPVEIPAVARTLPYFSLLPVFASLIPQMVVADQYAGRPDADDCSNAMSRHRVGWRCLSVCAEETAGGAAVPGSFCLSGSSVGCSPLRKEPAPRSIIGS